MTDEPIDICRKKEIINEAQHAAALHFRWLYTLKFGAAGVSAMDLNGINGRDIKNFNEVWLAERELEYGIIIERLRQAGVLRMVMNVVVFNHKPQFLTRIGIERAQIHYNTMELGKLREGLNILDGMRNLRSRPIHKLRY